MESHCSAQRTEFWVSVLGVFPSWTVAVMGSWRGVGCLVGVMTGLFSLGSVVGVMFVRGVGRLACSSDLGWLQRRWRGDLWKRLQDGRRCLRFGLRTGACEERRSRGRFQQTFGTMRALWRKTGKGEGAMDKGLRQKLLRTGDKGVCVWQTQKGSKFKLEKVEVKVFWCGLKEKLKYLSSKQQPIRYQCHWWLMQMILLLFCYTELYMTTWVIMKCSYKVCQERTMEINNSKIMRITIKITQNND